MQPSGNGDPSASVAPVGVGAGVVVTGALADEVGLVVDVGDVHDAATRALATMSKTARARMFPTVHRGQGRWKLLQRGHDLFGDVEVRVDVLHVVQVLERVDQPQDLVRLSPSDRDRRLRQHRELGR